MPFWLASLIIGIVALIVGYVIALPPKVSQVLIAIGWIGIALAVVMFLYGTLAGGIKLTDAAPPYYALLMMGAVNATSNGVTAPAKAWYQSKTIWFNVILGLVTLASSQQLLAVLPVSAIPYLTAIAIAGNLILRGWFTDTQLVGTQDTADVTNAKLLVRSGYVPEPPPPPPTSPAAA